MNDKSQGPPPIEPIESELRALNGIMSAVATELGRVAAFLAPPEPNFHYPIADYPEFAWSEIGAEAVSFDDHGATVVTWNHYMWKRRAGAGRFGPAVWFSRSAGRDENGVNYLRLITFKDLVAPERMPAEMAIAPAKPRPEPEEPPPGALVYVDETRPATQLERSTFERFVKAKKVRPVNRQALRRWFQQEQKAMSIAAQL
jgi:hypothetical protein